MTVSGGKDSYKHQPTQGTVDPFRSPLPSASGRTRQAIFHTLDDNETHLSGR
ncbi:hypothetical protein [Segatella maculosa]|uniref:hypothetical protein n=1 Tax=Segatella maculosa TaxID=439703 RepID=UPI0012DF766E|nr:hypothetical protein [Segatella maculosa]